MAGTLRYHLEVAHVFQRKFDTESLRTALKNSYWYLITRRSSVRILPKSRRIHRGVLEFDLSIARSDGSGADIVSQTLDLTGVGPAQDFTTHADGSYFSISLNGKIYHGDSWALASVGSGASPRIAAQQVMYIGQSFAGGSSDAWIRTNSHKKLQRIYADHAGGPWDIYVAPLIVRQVETGSDDHIDDDDDGFNLVRHWKTLVQRSGKLRKTSVDLVEHALIAYFAPPYNEKLTQWRAAFPTSAMSAMRGVGFRLIGVHLDGWGGLARFFSEQVPTLSRSHLIHHDIPNSPLPDAVRGVSAPELSAWRVAARVIRGGPSLVTSEAEMSQVTLKVFGDSAPDIRRPPAVDLGFRLRDPQWTEALSDSEPPPRPFSLNDPIDYPDEPTYRSVDGTIEIGRTGSGEATHWSLHGPDETTVHNGLIVGLPEAGKSNTARVIALEALRSGRFALSIADLGAGQPLSSLQAGAAGADWYATDASSALVNLRRLLGIAGLRQTKSVYPSVDEPMVLAVVDELDLLLEHQTGVQLIQDLLSLGPKSGIGLVATIGNLENVERLFDAGHFDLIDNKVAMMPHGAKLLDNLPTYYAAPSAEPPAAGRFVFVIYGSENTRVVGQIMSWVCKELTLDDARTWVETEALQDYSTDQLRWLDKPYLSRSAWIILNSTTAERHLLVEHKSGWVLINILSQVSGGYIDRQVMVDWASLVIARRFDLEFDDWSPGLLGGVEGACLFAASKGDVILSGLSWATLWKSGAKPKRLYE